MLNDHFLNHPGLQHFWDRLSSLFARKTELPTKVSELTNDAGYITGETDPTVPAWAKANTKPTYTASEVGALPDPVTFGDVDVMEPDNGISVRNERRMVRAVDKNGRSVALVYAYAKPDGSTEIALYAANKYGSSSTIARGIKVTHNKNGSVTYEVEAPANFRSAVEAQQDVGLYIDAQGYICQRIGSDT